MKIMAIANTGYQLSQDEPYDPYSLLKSELSTVLTRNKTLGQQISINVGINTLATTNPDDYGWNALGVVTGTLGSKLSSNIKLGHKYTDKFANPILSGYAGEYLGDPNRIKANWNTLERGIYEAK